MSVHISLTNIPQGGSIPFLLTAHFYLLAQLISPYQ
jgi:hypothetical protein